MKILVWQWGRRGAGPRYAAELAASLRALPGVQSVLSLSAQSELLAQPEPPPCDLPFSTYTSMASFLLRLPAAPFQIGPLAAQIRRFAPDVAICAMPAALDLLMARALRRAGVPFLVVVHDADIHPGDGFPMQMGLQRALVREADGLIALTAEVGRRLHAQDLVGDRPLVMTSLPPLTFGPPPPPPRAHAGPLRLLSFGRLLPYKGLDLLADALRLIGPRPDMELRVVGSGPQAPALDALRALPGVTVENRWVPEGEVAALLAWSDALVLSHREASQSGVAAAAIAAGRWVIATRVGGITEQLAAEPTARLCDPTAESLANAVLGLLAAPPAPSPQDDPSTTWRDVASALVRQIGGTLTKKGQGSALDPVKAEPLEPILFGAPQASSLGCGR